MTVNNVIKDELDGGDVLLNSVRLSKADMVMKLMLNYYHYQREFYEKLKIHKFKH